MIDAHVHVTEDGRWFQTHHDASLERLLREMDEAEVERAVILPIPGALDNEGAARLVARAPERLIGFGCVDFDRPLAPQLERAKELGLRGLKVHPRLQGIPLEDPRVDELCAGASARGLPALFCAYPQCRDPKVPLRSIEPYAYDLLAKRHPDLVLILAHLGGHRALDAYFVAKSNPNVYLDASYVLQALRHTSAYQDYLFVLEHLDRKVLFGSDFPEVSLPDYARLAREAMAGLASCDREAVCGGNLRRILGEAV